MTRSATQASRLQFRPCIGCTLLTAALAAILAIAACTLVLAANGALATRPGAWAATMEIAPHVSMRVNVAGMLRLATSDLGLALLDGREFTAGPGVLRLRRAGSVLVVDCEPCRVHQPWFAVSPVTLDGVRLQLARAPARNGGAAGKAASDRIEGRAQMGALAVPFSVSLKHDGVDIDWSIDDSAADALFAAFGAELAEMKFARVSGRVAARGHIALPSARATAHVEFRDLEVAGLGGEQLRSEDLNASCGANRIEPAASARPAFGPRLPAAVRTVVGAIDDGHATVPIDLPSSFDHAARTSASASSSASVASVAWPYLLAQALLANQSADQQTLLDLLRVRLYAANFSRTVAPERGLDLVLASARWGAHVCGARDAARLYFGKAPAQLSALEAAWLASALAAPRSAFEQQFLRRAPDVDAARRVLDRNRDLPLAERVRATGERLVFAPVPPHL